MLIFIFEEGKAESVKLLLGAGGVNVNAVEVDGSTPLHLASWVGSSGGRWKYSTSLGFRGR